MKNKYYFGLGLLLLVLLTACSIKKEVKETDLSNQVTTETTTLNQKKNIPTLFIHGYGGTKNSLGGMIRRFESQGIAEKELVLTVSTKGEVTASGQLTRNQNNPMIQVIFADNKNNEWNQAEWIKNCLIYLRDNQKVREVNLVTHSMGGVSSLRYMTTFGGDSTLPVIDKFVAIGSPFNNFMELSEGETIDTVLAQGPAIQSDRYADFVSGFDYISKDLAILIVAGDVEDGSLSDGIVPVADAISVVSLFQNYGNIVTEKIFYGKKAQHSQLHENTEVDQLVADFLWKKNE